MEDIVLYNIIVICLCIIVIFLGTYNTIQDKKHKEELKKKEQELKEKEQKELKEKEQELDRRFDIWKEKQEAFWKVYYKRKFEWWKHDYLAKKLDRISIRLTGNETMTIDYVDIKLRDNFLVVRDRDLNQILINKDFIREVRYYDSGNTRGSSEDDKG